MKYHFKRPEQAVEFMRYLVARSLDFNFRPSRMYSIEVTEEQITRQEIEETGQAAFLNGAYYLTPTADSDQPE